MQRKVLFTIIFISCLPITASTVISPALPLIAHSFGATGPAAFKVKLLIALPGLFTAIGAPLAGWIIDHWGRKPILYCGLLLYVASGALPGLLSQSLSGILLGRAFLGLALGILFTVATTFIADYFQGKKRNQVMGLQTASIAFTAIFTLAIGGALADLGWRLPFAVLFIALLGIPFAHFFLEDKKEEPSTTYQPPRIAWLWRYKFLPIIYFITCLNLMLFYLVPIEMPFVLTSLGISTQTSIGLIMATFNIAAGLSAIAYSRIKGVFNFQQIFALAFGIMGAGFFCIAFSRTHLNASTAISPALGIIIGLIIMGVGFGLTIPNASIWVQQETPRRLRGRVTSGLTTAIFLGQFLSPFLANALKSVGHEELLLGPLFGSSALICFILSLFFLSFKYSARLSSISKTPQQIS